MFTAFNGTNCTDMVNGNHVSEDGRALNLTSSNSSIEGAFFHPLNSVRALLCCEFSRQGMIADFGT